MNRPLRNRLRPISIYHGTLSALLWIEDPRLMEKGYWAHTQRGNQTAQRRWNEIAPWQRRTQTRKNKHAAWKVSISSTSKEHKSPERVRRLGFGFRTKNRIITTKHQTVLRRGYTARPEKHGSKMKILFFQQLSCISGKSTTNSQILSKIPDHGRHRGGYPCCTGYLQRLRKTNPVTRMVMIMAMMRLNAMWEGLTALRQKYHSLLHRLQGVKGVHQAHTGIFQIRRTCRVNYIINFKLENFLKWLGYTVVSNSVTENLVEKILNA